MKKIIFLTIFIFLSACKTTSTIDNSDAILYIDPLIKILKSIDEKPIFTKAEKRLAVRYSKNNNVEVLFRVVINGNGEVVKIRSYTPVVEVTPQLITDLKRIIKKTNYIDLIDLNSTNGNVQAAAFYIPWSIEYNFD